MKAEDEAVLSRHARHEEDARDWIELVPDAIVLVAQATGRLLGANTVALRMYGYSQGDLPSLTVHDLHAPEADQASLDQMVRADIAGLRFESLHRRKNGLSFPVEVSSRTARVGGEPAVVIVVRDITQRKRDEARSRTFELQLSEALGEELARLLAAPHDQVDRAVVEALRGMCRLLRMDRSAIWQGSPEEPTTLRLTHLCTLDEIPAVPEGITTNQAFPWFTSQLLAGRTVAVPDVARMPAEAEIDQRSLAHYRDQSTLAIPFPRQWGEIHGAISFAA